MKKILLTFYVLMACATTAFGQVSISTSDLIGTKWQLENAEVGHSKPFYEFTPKIALWHCSDGTIFSFPFYLSATIPTTFTGYTEQPWWFIIYKIPRRWWKIYVYYCCSCVVLVHRRNPFNLTTKDWVPKFHPHRIVSRWTTLSFCPYYWRIPVIKTLFLTHVWASYCVDMMRYLLCIHPKRLLIRFIKATKT